MQCRSWDPIESGSVVDNASFVCSPAVAPPVVAEAAEAAAAATPAAAPAAAAPVSLEDAAAAAAAAATGAGAALAGARMTVGLAFFGAGAATMNFCRVRRGTDQTSHDQDWSTFQITHSQEQDLCLQKTGLHTSMCVSPARRRRGG